MLQTDNGKRHFSRLEIDRLTELLAYQILASGRKFSQVVGIGNGGTHISSEIAAWLKLPHHTVRINYYDNMEKRESPSIIHNDDFMNDGNALIVDDLIDSGDTIKTFKEHFGDAAVAVLFWKKGSTKPDFYVMEKPDAWIVFPWEEE